MKKYLLTTLLFLGSLIGFTQEYPIIMDDENGNRIMILTVEQAKVLDKNSDLLDVYRNIVGEYDNLGDITLVLIENYGEIISTQKLTIESLENESSIKSEIINNLKAQIVEYEQIKANLTNINDINKKLIEDRDKEIKRQKTLKIIGYIGGGVLVIGALLIK